MTDARASTFEIRAGDLARRVIEIGYQSVPTRWYGVNGNELEDMHFLPKSCLLLFRFLPFLSILLCLPACELYISPTRFGNEERTIPYWYAA